MSVQIPGALSPKPQPWNLSLPMLSKGPWKGQVAPGVFPRPFISCSCWHFFDILNDKEFIEKREANNDKTKAAYNLDILSPQSALLQISGVFKVELEVECRAGFKTISWILPYHKLLLFIKNKINKWTKAMKGKCLPSLLHSHAMYC